MLMMLQGLKPLTFSWLNVAVKTATHKSMAVRCVAIEATAREEKTKRAETLRPGKLGRSSAAPLHDLADHRPPTWACRDHRLLLRLLDDAQIRARGLPAAG